MNKRYLVIRVSPKGRAIVPFRTLGYALSEFYKQVGEVVIELAREGRETIHVAFHQDSTKINIKIRIENEEILLKEKPQ